MRNRGKGTPLVPARSVFPLPDDATPIQIEDVVNSLLRRSAKRVTAKREAAKLAKAKRRGKPERGSS